MQVETVLDLRYNIAALAIAILKGISPEQAFAILEGKNIITVYNEEDIKDMVRLHDQGFSYRQIAEMYGLTKDAVQKRINRYKKKTSSSRHLKRSTK